MDIQIGGHGSIDLVEQLHEVDRVVALLAPAEHLVRRGIQRREQGGGAIALIADSRGYGARSVLASWAAGRPYDPKPRPTARARDLKDELVSEGYVATYHNAEEEGSSNG